MSLYRGLDILNKPPTLTCLHFNALLAFLLFLQHKPHSLQIRAL